MGTLFGNECGGQPRGTAGASRLYQAGGRLANMNWVALSLDECVGRLLGVGVEIPSLIMVSALTRRANGMIVVLKAPIAQW
jgi:hypothetical protein